jgi:FlaA1/EpsC-like NDP-sugar epimerase
VFVHDLLMIPVAWGLTYWVRFNLAYIPPEFIAEAVAMLPLVMGVMGASFWAFGLYRSVWRFASLTDLVRIAQAVATGTTLLLFLLFVFNRMAFVPRSLPLLFVIFQVLLLAGPRLGYRWLKDRRLDFGSGQRVLIVGAGRAGEMLVRDLLRDRQAGYVPVAFADDKPSAGRGAWSMGCRSVAPARTSPAWWRCLASISCCWRCPVLRRGRCSAWWGSARRRVSPFVPCRRCRSCWPARWR